MTDLLLNLADAVAPSYANGPGARAVLWAQGCSVRCEGCHNPQTWDFAPARVCQVSAALGWIRSFSGLRGVTLSGGEPFDQSLAFAALARGARAEGLDVIAYSGLSRREIEEGARPYARELLAEIDVLVDGPFVLAEKARLPLRGSSNQTIHCLTGRVRPDELQGLPVVEWIGQGERALKTGFSLGALRAP